MQLHPWDKLGIALGAALAVLGLAWAVYAAATAPLPPTGQAVLNQFQQGRAISSGTAFPISKAIYNGDGSACNITILLNLDTAPVEFFNVPAGAILPVMARLVSPTTCSDLLALY